jgi:predicted DNA-binding transcriptional regulator AlpA
MEANMRELASDHPFHLHLVAVFGELTNAYLLSCNKYSKETNVASEAFDGAKHELNQTLMSVLPQVKKLKIEPDTDFVEWLENDDAAELIRELDTDGNMTSFWSFFIVVMLMLFKAEEAAKKNNQKEYVAWLHGATKIAVKASDPLENLLHHGFLRFPTKPRLIDIKEVEEMIGFKKSKIHMMINEGDFPPQYKEGSRGSRWLEQDVLNWLRLKRPK